MQTVAVIGANPDRSKYANKAVRAFRSAGYEVHPVHPAHVEVEGLHCVPSIREVPVRPDIISVYVGPARLLAILPDIAERGCEELWLNPGTESSEVSAACKKLGLKAVSTCSILAVGASPAQL